MSKRGETARQEMLRRELERWQTNYDRIQDNLDRAAARALYYRTQLAVLENVPRVLEAAE